MWYYRESHRRADSSGKRKGKPSLEYNWYELNKIIFSLLAKFRKQGFDPTLRELYYALVSISVFPNLTKAYGSLSNHMTKGREKGLFPMDCLIDERHPIVDIDDVYFAPDAWIRHYLEKLGSLAKSYYDNNAGFPRWLSQLNYIEIWTEKQAMVKHLNQIVTKENLQVRIVSFGGYPGTTELNDHVEERLKAQIDKGKNVYILWFGDFDPSGDSIDRTTFERLKWFEKWSLEDYAAKRNIEFDLVRVAVSKEQIHKYNLPWNTERLSEEEQEKLQNDPRHADFEKRNGKYACEVDALPVIDLGAFSNIVIESVNKYFDESIYNQGLQKHKKDFPKEYIDNKLENYLRSFLEEIKITIIWKWLES